jgi:hypothetical protein
MSRGDKYAKASDLSKILDMLASKLGSRLDAKSEMDTKLGPGWQALVQDVQLDDIGSQFVEPELLDGPPCGPQEIDDAILGAAKLSDQLGLPSDGFQLDLYGATQPQTEIPKVDSGESISSLLRKLADMLE